MAKVNVLGGVQSSGGTLQGYKNVKFKQVYHDPEVTIDGPGIIIGIYADAKSGGSGAHVRIEDFIVDGVSSGLTYPIAIASNHNNEDAASAFGISFPWEFETTFKIECSEVSHVMHIAYVEL